MESKSSIASVKIQMPAPTDFQIMQGLQLLAAIFVVDEPPAAVGQLLERDPRHQARFPAPWRLSQRAEPTLRSLGERNEIIKRIHRGLVEQRIERSVSDFAIHNEDARQVIGRLVAHGLDDELKEKVYAVLDGVDGRVHHLRLPDLNALSDATPGSIVELRRLEDAAADVVRLWRYDPTYRWSNRWVPKEQRGRIASS